MDIEKNPPLFDDLFESYRKTLGEDFEAYRNHCCRVFNFCCALSGRASETREPISIAAFFHDLGIWTDSTFDYLAPSVRHAREYLARTGRAAWQDEIEAMIEHHHKLRTYRLNQSWLVEPFRKADWIDVSMGMLRFKLSDDFVVDVLDAFPNAGYHNKLLRLVGERMKTHPFSPLPMVRF
jgi:hypothetical protein